MFGKILIANRGEIAVRVAQTVQEMGIKAVAVYSDPDRDAPHVLRADEAYLLECKTAAETYLRGDRIIEIAQRHGVDAIHPGYGFLSENASFAEACGRAGIVFIGPTPEVIRAMGDKVIAKKTLAAAGVPVVPGWAGSGDENASTMVREAEKISFPLLVKAAAGGGGKGMRIVREKKELAAAIEAARREAGAAFGDSRVFLEKYIEHPRHVEIQILGDRHGHVVHLFERECSIQRRHQKIIEESPSPALTAALRERMGEAAVRAAQSIHYTNAGTVEFLVDDRGEFYFLEVNTRLQVEHPVTELTTGVDLVRAQIRVAAGEELPFAQEDLHQSGHAMEARICAEDPDHGFLPSTGTIDVFIPPVGPEIRVDSGVTRGSEVSVYYDSMLAKLIVRSPSREASLAKLAWALDHFVVLGVTTNIAFLRALIDHPEFRAGRLHTQFLQDYSISPRSAGDIPTEVLFAAGLRVTETRRSSGGVRHGGLGPATVAPDAPWRSGNAWRSA